MDTYQIIYGFSDIKSELRTKTQISKPPEQLELWFTFCETVLYVHDYDDHQKCIVLAIYSSLDESWKYFLQKESYGEMLIRHLCETLPAGKIIGELKNLYQLCGYIPFRRS